MLVSGYSDLIFNSEAAITLDAVNAGPAGAAILLVERSFDSTLPGTRHSSYDAAADTNSRFAVNLTANVTANGADQFGLFGYIGLRDDGSITTARRNTDDFAGFRFTNNQATVVVDVVSGASLTGGSGIGSAIAIQGTGNLIVTNAGSIVGRGGGQSAAIHVSSSAQLNPYLQFSLAPQTFQPDRFVTLRDMVNTGIVRSDAGHGIWAELGAIVNLTNRGLIHGGVASVRALQISSILNDAGGTLDGRILLEGAGSSLVNNGIVRVSTPGAVNHQINGGFTQGAAATLALRGGDRMNVIGNFVLNGDLNLALGAPNLDPVITVGANLTLDGRLNVTDAGGFGDGVYRLFNYGGTLTDNGLALGALPGGANGNLQTAIAGQVNLVVGAPARTSRSSSGTAPTPRRTERSMAAQAPGIRVRPTGRAPTAASTPLGLAISRSSRMRAAQSRSKARRASPACSSPATATGWLRARTARSCSMRPRPRCASIPTSPPSSLCRSAARARSSSATPALSSSPASTPIRAGP